MKMLSLSLCLLLLSCSFGKGTNHVQSGAQSGAPSHIQSQGDSMLLHTEALPVTNIQALSAVGDDLLMTDESGKLLRYFQNTKKLETLATGLSLTHTPVSDGKNVLFVNDAGKLSLWKNGHVQTFSYDVSPHSGLVLRGDEAWFISDKAHLAYLNLSSQKLTVRDDLQVLPDARPVLAHGQLAILAAPSERYAHGVLGDAVEATQFYLLDPKTLADIVPPLTLTGKTVFEANTIQVFSEKELWVAVISGDGAGARVGLIELNNGALTLRTAEALPSHRWQSPIVFGGKLYSVQMPHILGKLVRYDEHLRATTITEGLSNHHIGTHDTDISTVVGIGENAILLLPKLNGAGVVAFSVDGKQQELNLSEEVIGASGSYLKLRGGGVVRVNQP